jgi:energy-coupling factor transport system permease protein
MPDTLSLYLDRPSLLHALHPLTKLSLVGFLFVATLALPGVWAAYAVVAVAVVPLAASARVLRPLLGTAGRAALPFAISVFLVQGFFWPGGQPVLRLGPLSLKREGLIFAVASVGRILGIVSSFVLFALTTRPDGLMVALAQRGFPGSLAYLLVSTIQIVPRFQAKAQAILNAQRARGLETEGRLPTRLRALVPLITPLVLGSLVDVEERAMAIEARAFNRPGPKTSLLEVTEAAWERGARWMLLFASLLTLGLSVWLRLGGNT